VSQGQLAVGGPHFLPLLRRLDECLAYVAANPHYADAASFALKFRQLHSRALGSVRSRGHTNTPLGSPIEFKDPAEITTARAEEEPRKMVAQLCPWYRRYTALIRLAGLQGATETYWNSPIEFGCLVAQVRTHAAAALKRAADKVRACGS
jgi:hypothetical protein